MLWEGKMAERDTFTIAEEFADVDFNEERLEKRFRQTMETLSKDPQKSIYASSANRAEAKAIYNLLGNDKFNTSEILRAHRAATIRRMEGQSLILAVQDTTSVNYDGQREMEGSGYIGDKTMGVNIHSCLALTPEGLVLGVLDQMGFNRAEQKNTALTREQQKNRPIEQKESNRWLETMEKADGGIPATIKVLHICDRKGTIMNYSTRQYKAGGIFSYG
jgi:hypothetical protein